MRTKTGIILAVAGTAIGFIAGRIMENMSAEKDLSERIDNTGSKDLEDYLYEHYYGADLSDEDDAFEDESSESDVAGNEDLKNDDIDKAVSFIIIDWKDGKPVPTKMTVEEFEKKYGGL